MEKFPKTRFYGGSSESIKWSKELRDCEVKNDEIYVKSKLIENRGEI